MFLPARTRNPRTVRIVLITQPQRGGFGLQSANFKNPENGRPRANERRYRAGDTVRQSGIYEVLHDRDHREVHEVVMISGELFPDCETCKDKVRFRLVRTAPYIFQDEDFEEDI